jgi:hypothetical protein
VSESRYWNADWLRTVTARHRAYRFNPACHCVICENGGKIPEGTPDNGHSFAYEDPHIPPCS